MLRSIHVKNLALIDETEVEFGPGLNILTGETGAGKSIIIGAISFALGGKISKDMIRTGADYALAELDFCVEDPDVLRELEEMDLAADGNELTVSRKISGNRSVCRINGETVSLQVLRQAAELLIDIHGQNEHQSLLDREKHLEILDEFAKSETAQLKGDLKKHYSEYSAVRKETDSAVTDEKKRFSEMDFLKYQIDEITAADLVPGEEEELDRKFRKMSHSLQIMECAGSAHKLTGYDDEASAGNLIGKALHELYPAQEYDESVSGLISQLTDIDALLNDFNRELADYESGLSFDEEAYHETEDRLELIAHLKSKYGSGVDEILAYRDNCRKQYEKLRDYEDYLSDLNRRLDEADKCVRADCDALSDIRARYAKVLEEKITGSLTDLNFADVRFQICLRPIGHCTANGQESAEFLISTNPGEPMKPLSHIASGGELSRIMLAVRSVLADSDAVGTLIFDEIDTGISGRTAQKVSEKMALIARGHQVMCITHLPQIASMADIHFCIEKTAENDRTVTVIRRLSEEESVSEIGRLLGGVAITDAVMENAREMKELARAKKYSTR